MMTETQIGEMQLEAKECQGLLATTRSQEEAREDSTQRFRENMALWTP